MPRVKIPEILMVETVHQPGSLAKVLQVIADAGLTIDHLQALRREQGRTVWEITLEMDEEADRSLYDRIDALPIARFVGKSVGVLALTYFSGVRRGAAGLLCLTLTPMSGLAISMVHGTTNLYPEFGAKLAAIVLSAVLILELIGPVAVQFALRRAGEAMDPEAR